MDPYKYFFKQFNFKIKTYYPKKPKPDNPVWFEVFYRNFHVGTFYKPTNLKNLYQLLINTSKSHKSQRNLFQQIFRVLKQFPDELESKEHVDLLLTLHGMNKEA